MNAPNRTDAKAAALAAIEKKAAADRADVERNYAAISALPEGCPMPRFSCATKLYGATCTMVWGDSFQGYNSKPNPSLKDALALLDKIGTPLDLFTVKTYCLAIKPEAAITEREWHEDKSESGEIEGPFYGAKLRREYHGARLEAYVTLAGGIIANIDIHLADANKFGTYRAEGLNGGGMRSNAHDTGEFKLVGTAATIGQGKTVRYSGGSHRGNGSAVTMVYLYHDREALDALAETFAKVQP